MSHVILNTAAAFILSAALTRVTIGICRKKGWLFHPRSDRWSRRSVAKCGGLAVIASFLMVSIGLPHAAMIRSVLLLTAVMALLGFWDDVKPLKPVVKLCAQVALAAAAVSSGVVYPVENHHWIGMLVSVFWIVGITNGFNLLDNMDGLSAGVAAIAVLDLYFLVRNSTLHPAVLLVFSGALLGFLVYNFYPAKIFMGDTGSLAIGFFISCMAILGMRHISQTASVVIAPVLLMFLPIFDTALVSVTRRINGRPINAGARDHSSHRLVLLGLSDRAAVITLYVLSSVSGVVAYLCVIVWPQAGFGIILLFLIASTLFWLYLAQLQLPESWLSRTNIATVAIPEILVSLSRRALVMAFDSILFGVSLYLGFLLRFDHVIVSLSLFCSVWALSILTKLPLLSLFGAYRTQSSMTLKDLYPITKSAILSFLIMATILEFFLRDTGVPRAVLATDVVLTCCLLTMSRIANRFFNELLPGRVDEERCVLVGNGTAKFYQHVFKSEMGNKSVRAVAIASSLERLDGVSVPQIQFEKLSDLLIREKILQVYVLPDCPPEYEAILVNLCSSLECKVSSLLVQSVPVATKQVSEFNEALER